jgi:YidC/Oxa1 family membrane protein insertase
MNTPYMAPQQAKIMGIAAIVMTPLSLFVTVYFPAGLQWFFLMTGALQYLQTWLFYQPWLRRWANLPELVVRNVSTPSSPQTSPFSAKSAAVYQSPRTISTTATPVKDDSVMSSVRSGMQSFKEKINTSNESKKKTSQLKEAQAYEARRALEEEEKYHARREEKSMKKRDARFKKL